MRYVNNGGGHTTPDGTTVPHGGTFESDDTDLTTKFPNKFTRVITDAPEVPPSPVKAEEDTDDGDTDKTAADPNDVTADFPTAKAADLTVTKDKTGWWVRDDGDAVNDKACRTKKAVEKAIADYTAE